ncbi:MAG: hypothetical protein A2W38_01085 [Deltaproteobacteria bacterium RBG_19FT_COMBO_58_16]|nr:MAG: hypothetical protein A2W38_01085 [Deltaproteobacteria bacterium RBG_19FT_COMBO_58_16]
MRFFSKIKKISALLAFFVFVTFSGEAFAEDMMQTTLRDALYGGIVGALIGSAVVLLTDNPEDHLGFIPTGAGVGILVGAAYGVATSGVISTAGAEIEDGKLTLNMPTIRTEKVFDEMANVQEVIEKVDLIRVRF